MSKDYSLFSTELRIRSSNWGQMTEAAEKQLDDYFDAVDFDVASEHEGVIVFTINFNADAGDSFPQKIEKLTNAVNHHLLDAGMLTLREDTLEEERDQLFFTGPTPESIRLAEIRHRYSIAKEALHELDAHSEFSLLSFAAKGTKKAIANSIALVDQQIARERAQREVTTPVDQEATRTLGRLVLGATCNELGDELPAYVVVPVTEELLTAVETALAMCSQNHVRELQLPLELNAQWAPVDLAGEPQNYLGPVELTVTQDGFRIVAKMPWNGETFYSTEVTYGQLMEHITSERTETLLDDDLDTSELQAVLDTHRAGAEAHTGPNDQPQG